MYKLTKEECEKNYSKYDLRPWIEYDVILIPSNITKIGDYVFSCCKCSKILNNCITERFKDENKIIMPKIKSIGKFAFALCENIKEIIFQNSLISIGDCAFLGCSNLEFIKIPYTVKTIGRFEFLNCKPSIEISYKNQHLIKSGYRLKIINMENFELSEKILKLNEKLMDGKVVTII